MNHHNTADDKYIHETYMALTSGNRRAARRWAEQLVRLDPHREEAWEILGMLAAPRASVYYMRQALRMNPRSERARAGLRWALARLETSKEKPMPSLSYGNSSIDSRAFRRSAHPLRIINLGLSFFLILIVGLALDTYVRVEAASISLPTMPAAAAPADAENGDTVTPFALPPSVGPAGILSSDGEDSSIASAPALTSVPPADHLPSPTNTDQPTSVVETPLPAVPSPVVILPHPSISGTKKIVVSLSQQHLYAYQGDGLVFDFVVSTGQGGGTAVGNFQILDKISDAFSEPWGFWMPYWMGIYYATPYLENGFHALPVLSNGLTIWGNELGTPVSYGCVVLGTRDAQRLFEWANVGTQVSIQK